MLKYPAPARSNINRQHVQRQDTNDAGTQHIRLSQVISALSYVLDMTEGQPTGHAVRSCIIGMRIASEIGLSTDKLSALFYALLLKDSGCSSNAGRVCSLFGADDLTVKRNFKTVDWSRLSDSLRYAARNVSPQSSPMQRALRMLALAFEGQKAARELVHIRCERGEQIARMLDLPEETARAIRLLDEHWDGRGHPEGLKGKEIPLLSRVLCLAQTVEVFFTTYGLSAAFDMLEERRGTWFDPALVDAFLPLRADRALWDQLKYDDLQEQIVRLEPEDRILMADDARVDRIAEAFAKIVDAKSPWTYLHSQRVAEIAVGIGEIFSLSRDELRRLRRAALLHDIGKLGVSNLVLDKPGPLTDQERDEMKGHAEKTGEILSRVRCFSEIADLAASHHERLDGTGYNKGLKGEEIPTSARILTVADIYDALTSDRPYRRASTHEEALAIMRKDIGTAICRRAFTGLELYLRKSRNRIH
ncbi:MAG: HD domain-containing protein [Blastocatellia bacterium]|nr:HD domain-containing protein [Blastocatellia bacterium]